ncbi:hypothetical protein Acr_05g0010090 [Actinidia rufa]|uniref:Uncharacterized protein n=1 Tax=Actinidia rufa TaxID=165716 RepID=A0A7J0ELU7_9ERIC|nr:hypothetical protein Acr_05g0010090 [Actinidia rufa]
MDNPTSIQFWPDILTTEILANPAKISCGHVGFLRCACGSRVVSWVFVYGSRLGNDWHRCYLEFSMVGFDIWIGWIDCFFVGSFKHFVASGTPSSSLLLLES